MNQIEENNSLYGCAVRISDYLVYFANISICDALPQFNDDECKVLSRLCWKN